MNIRKFAGGVVTALTALACVGTHAEEKRSISAEIKSAVGAEITYYGDYVVYEFKDPSAAGSLVVETGGKADIFVVGGGGSGGCVAGGGGAGGQVIDEYDYDLPAGTYTITIGEGGKHQENNSRWSLGTDGGDTIICNSTEAVFTAVGGGAGAGYSTGVGCREGGLAGGGARTGGTGAGGAAIGLVGGAGIECNYLDGVTAIVYGAGGSGGREGPGDQGPRTAGGSQWAGEGGAGNPDNYTPNDPQGGKGVDGTGSGGGGGGWWCVESATGQGGGDGGSGVVIVRVWLNENDDPKPNFNFTSASSGAADSVDLAWNLWKLGYEATECEMSLNFGFSADKLDRSITIKTVDSANGPDSATVKGLSPETTYYGKLIVNNGKATAESEVFSFTTMVERLPAGVNGKPGIYQAMTSNQWQDNFDILNSDTLAIVDATYATFTTQNSKPLTWTGTSVKTGEDATFQWGDYQTYGYQTYMWFDAGSTYTFYNDIDDYGSIYIEDGSDNGFYFYKQGTGTSGGIATAPSSTYTAPASGWFKVRIYVGNATGGYGMYNHEGGFCYTMNGKASPVYWFRNEEGNEKYLLNNGGQITAGESYIIGENFITSVNFGERAVGGTYTIYWSETYTTDPAAWGTALASGSIEAAGLVQLRCDLDGRTGGYLRVVAVKDDDISCTTAKLVAEIDVLDNSAPSENFVSLESTAADAATLVLTVISCGGDATTAKAVVKYGDGPGEDMTEELVFEDLSVGVNQLTIRGLEANHAYYLSYHVENDNGGATEETEVKSFMTQTLPGYRNVKPGTAGYSLPGWYQAYQNGTFSGAVENDPTVKRTMSTYAANVYWYPPNGYSPYWTVYAQDGTAENSTWTANYTFAYSGYVYLQNQTYYFYGNVDDAVKLVIDGTTYFSGNGGQSCTFNPTRGAGWYKFHFEAIDWGGAAGNTGGLGFSYNNGAGNMPLIDSGNGSFIRTQPGVKDGTVTGYSRTAEKQLSAKIEFQPWQVADTVELRLAYGRNLGGATPADWEQDVSVNAAITSETNVYDFVGLENVGTDSNFYHFYVKATVGENTYWQWVGDTLQIADGSKPMLSSDMAFSGEQGDGIRVTGRVLSAGGDEDATLKLYVSENADMTSAIEWDLGTYASEEDVDITVRTDDTTSPSYIKPDTTYYVQLVLTAATSKRTKSSVNTVTTVGAPVFVESAFSSATSYANATLKFAFAALGPGNTATVDLYIGETADTMEKVDTKTVTEINGTVSFDYECPKVDTTYSYKYVASAACATKSWSVESPVMTVKPIDQYTYLWNPATHTGNWEDPANWTVDGNPKQATYPHTRSCAAVFYTNADNKDEPYIVSLSSAANISTFRVWWSENLNMDLTIAGTGPDASITANDGWGSDYVSPSTKLTLKDLSLTTISMLLGTNLDVRFDNVNATITGDVRTDSQNITLRMIDSTIVQSGGNFYNYGDGFHWIVDNSSYRITSGGCIRLAHSTANSGKILIELMGEHPELYAMYHFFSLAEDGANNADVELLFHVPVNGYAKAPILCTNDSNWKFQAGNGVLNLSIAKDSPARKTPKSFTTTLVECTGTFDGAKFRDDLLSFNSEYGEIVYNDTDPEKATKIQTSFVAHGFAVFVR